MDFYGHIELNDNEMQKMVLQVETDFPTTPVEGRIVFKGSRVWICVEVEPGTLAWVPLMSSANTYIHEQETTLDTWTVTHNLGSLNPIVQVFDDTMNEIIPQDVSPVDANELTITLHTSMVGRAVVMFGNQSIYYPPVQ